MPHPHIIKCASLHLALGSNNPAHNICATSWDQQIIAHLDHPLLVNVTDNSLEWLVISDINWLGDASATRRDADDLDTEIVDGMIDGAHFVDPKVIKEKKGIIPAGIFATCGARHS